MPKVSIIIPTMRVGGLNLLFDALAQQEYPDFELVLVDGLKRHRAAIVAEEAANRFLRVVHVEPAPNPWPVAAFCQYANTGLVAASGEIALFMVDYSVPPPDLVKKHVLFHARSDGQGNRGLMAPHRYVELAVSPDFPRYAGADVDLYERDIKSGDLDRFMFSLGKATDRPAPDWVVDGGTIAKHDADPKLRLPAGPVPPSFFHGKNESVLLERAIEINGWDEDLDGAHGWQDSDFADRLSIKAGVQWSLDPTAVNIIANPRGIFPFARRVRDFRTNEGIWFRKRGEGYPTPNKYSLRERRGFQRMGVPASGNGFGMWDGKLYRTDNDGNPIGPPVEIRDMPARLDTTDSKPIESSGQNFGRIEPDHDRRPINALVKPMRICMIYGEFSSAIHGPFDLDGLYTRVGLTGSESSFFNLARSLAEMGHEVAVFCVCNEPTVLESGVNCLPIQALQGMSRLQGIDAVIAWNEPDYLRFAPAGALRVCDQQLNDFGYCRAPNWWDLVDLWISPSENHRHNVMCANGAQTIPTGRRIEVIPNSVDLDLFQMRNPHAVDDRRASNRVVWCSSPDRGLHHLLGWWPEIRERVPAAELRIFYRLAPWLDRARNSDDAVGRRARYIEHALGALGDRFGVTVLDLVPNERMAQELQEAAVLAYPCDPVRYTEGFGCSVLDAAAGGCLPIISDADALPSVHGSAAGVIAGKPADQRAMWIDRISWALSNPQELRVREAMQNHAIAHDRKFIAKQWEDLLVANRR